MSFRDDDYHIQNAILRKALWFFAKVFLIIIIPAVCVGVVVGICFK